MHLSKEEQSEVLLAIQEAEMKTSGEIRVHVESHCPGHPMDRAKELFFQLSMDQTDLQNGILIYLAIKDRKYAIIGDKGIDAKVPLEFWDTIRDEMRPILAKSEFSKALALGVHQVGEALIASFPFQKGDINELSNEISFGA